MRSLKKTEERKRNTVGERERTEGSLGGFRNYVLMADVFLMFVVFERQNCW